jgi:Cdc6-like AAA superfamily ATPase
MNNLLKGMIKDELNDSQNKENYFFHDENNVEEEKSDAWKMIIGLIVSQLTNSSIFLQGCPGSGKSCAARYYGSQRNSQNREPILSINFNKDLEFDKLIGNYSFKNNKFEFNEGPLLTAMKNGEAILFDEFNLCSESILVNFLEDLDFSLISLNILLSILTISNLGTK